MLAALLRRASRTVVGLAVVAAFGVGLVVTPLWAPLTAAHALENAASAVRINVFPTSGASISPGNDFSVTVTIANTSSSALAAGHVVVTTGSPVLATGSDIDDWLAAADNQVQSGQWLGVIATPAIAAGSTLEVTDRLPLSNAYYGTRWGPRGLAADLEIGTGSAGAGRGVLVWAPTATPGSTSLVTLLPVVTPATTSGLLTAAELSALTASSGVLTSQLNSATGRDVTLAVDPRIVASITVLGTAAPESATAWLARLLTLSNQSFALAYADADPALQAQAGAATLQAAGFTDQPLLSSPATPAPSTSASPSAVPSSAPSATPTTGPLPVASSWIPTVEGVTWPAENTVIAADLATFAASGALLTILSSSNVASGANSPAHTSVAGQKALVTNSGLSSALRKAAAATTESSWSANFSLASAYLAASALNPSTQSTTIATLSRDAVPALTNIRLTQTLDRVAALEWVTGGSFTGVSGSANSVAPTTTIVDKPEDSARVIHGQSVVDRHAALTNFSTVLDQPAALTDASSRSELALYSLAWRGNDGWGSAIGQYLASTTTTLSSIHIVSSSEINMVGGQVNIPVTVENNLKLAANVLVRATPSNARLTVDADATVVLQAGAQGKALVPVKARVGNGSVTLSVTLYSPSGVPIGTAVSLPVNVRADWETWGIGALGILFAGLIVAGIVRTVRKRRPEADAVSRG